MDDTTNNDDDEIATTTITEKPFNLCSIRLAQQLCARVEYSALYVLLKCLLYRYESHDEFNESLESTNSIIIDKPHHHIQVRTPSVYLTGCPLRLDIPSACMRFQNTRFMLYMRDVLVEVYASRSRDRASFSHIIYLSHVYATRETRYLLGDQWNYPSDYCVHLTSTHAKRSLIIPMSESQSTKRKMKCYIRHHVGGDAYGGALTTTTFTDNNINNNKDEEIECHGVVDPKYEPIYVDRETMHIYKHKILCIHDQPSVFPLFDFIEDCLEIFTYVMRDQYKKLGRELTIRLNVKPIISHPEIAT